ncbi:MAG: acyl-CoA dehydrogenase, partial [Desulfobacterales bacterium]|nr:acyl-CoA dehydrogenase [Desulfobacterales bacterium]
EQIKTYIPKMLAGEWQGTMALTEPQAGSSLSDITTTATPQKDGSYRIKGHKIFISGGDNNCVDNIIHLMLVKIEGAPLGVKGISLFIVPKNRLDPTGDLVPNDITVAAVYHKLGYRGCPLTELSIGENNDCVGYLVGEPHRGLIYMFQLMNEARIGVGLGAASIATAGYYASLEYASARPQGRPIGKKDLAAPQIPIIEHADVKRMLLFQRAVIEGSLSILMQCSLYSDLENLQTGEEREKARLLLEILTPIAKTYPSEMGVLSVSSGLQCFGGYGYCDDFPLEQYYRDARIHPIHEGTTGIQGMDLLGRKVGMEKGKAFLLFISEVQEVINTAEKIPELASYATELAHTLEELQETTQNLGQIAAEKGAEIYLADATLYLEYFGIITIAWQWLLQAIVVHKALEKKLTDAETRFYKGKRFTFKYFFEYELPKTKGLAIRLRKGDGLTVDMKTDYFND